MRGLKTIILPIGLLFPLYFSTILFAGVHLWVQSLLLLFILSWWTGRLLVGLFKRVNDRAQNILVNNDPVSLLGILFLAWIVFQIVPLPPGFLKIISPRSYELWESTALLGNSPAFRISLYPYATISSLLFGLTLFLYYWLLLYGLKKRDQIHWLLSGGLVLGVLESLYGLIQEATRSPYLLWWKRGSRADLATGTFINRNHLAAFLSLVICLGIGYLWSWNRVGESNSSGKRLSLIRRIAGSLKLFSPKGYLVFLAVGLMITGLLATGSRGGIVSLAGGIIFMTGMLAGRFQKNKPFFLFLVLLSAVGSYAGYWTLDRFLGRFYSFETGIRSRLSLSHNTFLISKSSPLTGTGLGTFEAVYPGYQDADLDKLVDYAHNDWLQLLSETGWVGMTLVLAGLIWVLGNSLLSWQKRQDPFTVGIGLGGMGALVSISLHSLVDFSLHLPAIALLLTLVLAILTLALYSKQEGEEDHFYYPTWRLPLGLWIGIPLVGLVLLGEAGIAKRVIREWQANSLARTHWNSTQPFSNPTNEALHRAWELAPGNGNYWLWMAGRVSEQPQFPWQIPKDPWTQIDDPELWLLGKGLLRNPTNWAIWRQLGWAAFYRMDKDPGRYRPLALKAFNLALLLRPNAPQGYLEYGIGALRAEGWPGPEKNPEVWRKSFQKALTLEPSLTTQAVNQVTFYLGREGAKEVKSILPQKAQAYRMGARHLFKNQFWGFGLELLKEGELLAEGEVKVLWKGFLQQILRPRGKKYS